MPTNVTLILFETPFYHKNKLVVLRKQHLTSIENILTKE